MWRSSALCFQSPVASRYYCHFVLKQQKAESFGWDASPLADLCSKAGDAAQHRGAPCMSLETSV